MTWLHSLDYVHRVLYLTPINGTRLAGTKRKTIEMMTRMLTEPHDALECLTFVTTMWDTMHNEQALERAHENFSQLRDVHLKAINVIIAVKCLALMHIYFLL